MATAGIAAGCVPSTGRYRRHRFPMLLKRRNRYGIDFWEIILVIQCCSGGGLGLRV
jgi:hypothetical protein